MSRVRLGRSMLVLCALGSSACVAGTKVKYVDGQCVIDGVPTGLARVEELQAQMTQHVLSRQPILTAIAIAVVAVGLAGYVQRIMIVLAARRQPAQAFGERLRARMERYRAHPVRYFLLLGGVLGSLVAAGITYVALDADKRASERALASLQFCHLALRSADEQHVLAEQRDHLAAIQSTERDIRGLVDKLPPAEQQKAREIVAQLSTSLGQQRAMVAQFAEHADTAAKAVAEHQAQVERGLSKLNDDVGDLKSMPTAVAKLSSDVRDVRAREDTLAGEVEACNARLETIGKGIDALGKQLEAVAARSSTSCSCDRPTPGIASKGNGPPAANGTPVGVGSNASPLPVASAPMDARDATDGAAR